VASATALPGARRQRTTHCLMSNFTPGLTSLSHCLYQHRGGAPPSCRYAPIHAVPGPWSAFFKWYKISITVTAVSVFT
jgi:hypothetical protein